ncbi:MarR family winged helix-turn-helix transcriptional regulator [Frigidibacter sp. MR17.24]|uniref:MarR family winged helix-turn-helix transcriptional regulator n=1 Tax=Frigidibacter sp. MR17.24 TaxID=3127345 RepID=UPI003012D610
MTDAPPPPRDALTEEISATLGQLRLLIGRRLLGRVAVATVAPGLELSALDVLNLVPPEDAAGDTTVAEVTVGDVARGLRVDPSRASRLVADLVDKGLLSRAVSQADARRSILYRTAFAERIVAEIRRLKHEVIAEITADWQPDEVTVFADLFARFVAGWDCRLAGRDPETAPAAQPAPASAAG